jgi:hypothetical protein
MDLGGLRVTLKAVMLFCLPLPLVTVLSRPLTDSAAILR